jgi:formate/nitrite transporter FocA (FNT family)
VTSDLAAPPSREVEPKKGTRQILSHEISEGSTALERSSGGLFISGLSAGLDIGFSLFLMAVARSLTAGTYPAATVSFLVAGAYAVGFIFVVLGRSELFTEQTTLAVLPVLSGDAKFAALIRLWAIVFVANLIGAAGFAALAVAIGPALGVIDRQVFGEMARHVIDHPAAAIFGSAVLAGWLMGLLSWLVAASRDTISQIVVVAIITSVIGLCRLHHVVVGSVEVLAGLFAGPFVTPAEFGRFLVLATLGNALGGSFFVAFIKYSHAVRGKQGE